jgi:hypothetical protein
MRQTVDEMFQEMTFSLFVGESVFSFVWRVETKVVSPTKLQEHISK